MTPQKPFSPQGATDGVCQGWLLTESAGGIRSSLLPSEAEAAGYSRGEMVVSELIVEVKCHQYWEFKQQNSRCFVLFSSSF